MPAFANHLLQSTIFAAMAGMLTLLLRNNHARTRYWIWLTASLKFLIPFSLFVELGHRLTWPGAPVIAQPRLAVAMDQFSQPFVTPNLYVSTSVGTAIVPSIVPALFAIWIAGYAVVLLLWFLRWRRVAAILRAAVPVTSGRELSALRRVDAKTRLIVSPSQMEPGVFGILRPVLSLPVGIAEHLDDAQLEAIFAHEICHVRRRDNLTAAIHMLVEAIFWFHPLVWWIGSRLVEERERACDEDVVRRGSDPEVYAESILKICRFYVASPIVCAAGISGSDLAKRIENIVTKPVLSKLSRAKKVTIATLGLLALAAPISIGILSASANRPHPRATAAIAVPAPSFVDAAPEGRLIAQADPVPPRIPAPTTTQAQPASSPRLEFEVASVRPVGSGMGRGPMRGGPGTDDPERFSWENVYLRSLLMKAYGIRIDQISGPAWLDSEKYTIAVKIPSGTTNEQFQTMLQNLLIDRFQMTVHHETREFAAWELVVAKGGPRIKDSSLAPNAARRRDMGMGDDVRNLPVNGDGFAQLGDVKGMTARGSNGSSFETYQGATIASFIQSLSMRMGPSISANRFAPAIIIDKTGLTGEYDFTFEFSQASAPMPRFNAPIPGDPAAGPEDPPRGTDFFVALEKQLGLKLQKTSTMADVLVIDHAEKVPTEN